MHDATPTLERTRSQLSLHILQAEHRQRRATCEPGCTHCCHQLVPLAPGEPDAIADAIAELPSDLQAKVRFRTLAAEAHFDAIGLLELTSDLAAAPAGGLAMLGEQWRNEWQACPLLIDQRCAIYDDRPLACRAQAVVSDPAECGKHAGRVVPLDHQGRGIVGDLCAERGEPPVGLLSVLIASVGEAGGREVGLADAAGR